MTELPIQYVAAPREQRFAGLFSTQRCRQLLNMFRFIGEVVFASRGHECSKSLAPCPAESNAMHFVRLRAKFLAGVVLCCSYCKPISVLAWPRRFRSIHTGYKNPITGVRSKQDQLGW